MIDERLPFYKLDAELQLFLYDEFRKMTNEQVKLLFQSVDEYAQAKSDEEKNSIIERFKKCIWVELDETFGQLVQRFYS